MAEYNPITDVYTEVVDAELREEFTFIKDLDLQEKTATANGIILPDAGKDGLSKVTVAVPMPSGSIEITEDGEYDVTMKETAIVNVGGGGSTNILSGADVPTASEGNNGDIYLKLGLAEGYTPLEYLEVTSEGPYINTGIKGTSTISFELKAQMTVIPQKNMIFFGANDYSSQNIKMIQAGFVSGQLYCCQGNGTAAYKSPDLNAHIFSGNSDGAFIDGELLEPAGNSFPSSLNLHLFARTSHATVESKSSNSRIYYCKIWDNGTLVRDMRPAKNSSNTLGMYDVISKSFYTRSGSGSFVAGPEETEPDIIIKSYCKVLGAWQDLIGSNIDDVNTGN